MEFCHGFLGRGFKLYTLLFVMLCYGSVLVFSFAVLNSGSNQSR